MKIKRLLAFALAGTLCLSETAWALPDNGGIEYQIPEKYLAVPGEIELTDPVEVPVEIPEEEIEVWEDNFGQLAAYEEDSDAETEEFEPAEEPEEDVFYEETPVDEPEEEPADEPAELEEYAAATVSNSSRYAAISNTLQDDEISIEIVSPKTTLYSYMPLTLKIKRTQTATEAEAGTDPVQLKIFVDKKQVKEIECKYGSEQEVVIPGENFPYSSISKTVTIAIKDQDGAEVTSKEVTLEPLMDFEITLKEQIFTKTYGAKEPASYNVKKEKFTATKDGVELAQFDIGAVTYEPKPDKEDAGSYPIEKLTSSKYGTLTVVKNDFSNFVIKKKWASAYGKSGLRIAADGNQKSIDIKQLYTSKNEEEPVFTLGTIDDATAAKFKVQPKYENGKLTFTPKESQTKYEISIPFKAESKNYYFTKVSSDEMLTVTIMAEPRTAPVVRTIDEQRKYFEAHPFDLSARDGHVIVPDAKNGIAGRLNSESEKNALNSLNLVRYIAGLNEVTITDEFSE